MEPATTVPASSVTVLTFEDGLGLRYRVQTGGDTHAQLEVLCFRSELTDTPSFEFALRERVGALSSFRHTYFAQTRRVARMSGKVATLAMISESTPGVRLSEVLEVSGRQDLPLDIDTALCLVRQLVSAVAMFHQNAHVAHGALGPERVIITPNARVVIVEFALGAALEQLRYSRERYWRSLRIALPPSAGFPEFNECADVTQLGVIALSLVLGRPLRDEEYPADLEELVGSACSRRQDGQTEPLSSGLRDWLRRTLQLDVRHSFRSVSAAQAALDELLTGEETYTADPAALATFLARYHESADTDPSTSQVSWRPAVMRNEERTEVAMPVPIRRVPMASPQPAEMPFAPEEREEEVSAMRTAPKTTTVRRRAWVVACLVLTASAGILFAGQRYFLTPSVSMAMGTLAVDTNPPGALIFIDDQQRGQTPARLSLPPGEHTLVIQGEGETRTLPVTIAAGATASQYVELPKAKEATGQVQISTDPNGARVSVDGLPRGITPLIISDLTPGEHVVTLDSELGSIRQAVRIEAGVSASLIVPLAPKGMPASGWMSVSVGQTAAFRNAPTVEMQLYEQGRLLGTTGIDRIMLPVGKHQIEIVNDALGYRETRTVQVSPGKTAAVPIELPQGSMSLNAIPWASVWIDDQNVGETPIGNLSVPIGSHEVVFRNPELGEQRRAITVKLNAPTRLSIDLTKK